MAVITVPVTSGGKKRTMRQTKGAISRPKAPAAMVAPKMPVMPTPGMPAMTTMLLTAAKLAPIITGMRMPIGPMPSDCTSVAMPATSRSALIKGDFIAGQPGRLADDQRYGDGTAVHQQHMLQAHQQLLQPGQPGRPGGAGVQVVHARYLGRVCY